MLVFLFTHKPFDEVPRVYHQQCFRVFFSPMTFYTFNKTGKEGRKEDVLVVKGAAAAWAGLDGKGPHPALQEMAKDQVVWSEEGRSRDSSAVCDISSHEMLSRPTSTQWHMVQPVRQTLALMADSLLVVP